MSTPITPEKSSMSPILSIPETPKPPAEKDLSEAAVQEPTQSSSKNSQLSTDDEKSIVIRSTPKYPQKIAGFFESCGINISALPELDLKGRCNDVKNFILKEAVTAPLMRFKDAFGRLGIAIKMRRHPEIVKKSAKDLKKRILNKALEAESAELLKQAIADLILCDKILLAKLQPEVLILFQKGLGCWNHTWSPSDYPLEEELNDLHKENSGASKAPLFTWCADFFSHDNLYIAI